VTHFVHIFNIPCAQVTIERLCSIEHQTYSHRVGDIPSREIFVDGPLSEKGLRKVRQWWIKAPIFDWAILGRVTRNDLVVGFNARVYHRLQLALNSRFFSATMMSLFSCSCSSCCLGNRQ
jgi:hypothetical protein